MRNVLIYCFLLFTLLLSTYRCSMCNQSKSNKQQSTVLVPGPQAIIYITRADYSKLVPIILSPDRKSIQSYPDVKDVFLNGKLAYPISLHNGYMLDNRGISVNVAFIKLTYKEYAVLAKTPTAKELMNLIVDKKPLKVMYACGLRSKFVNINDELNAAIDAGNFSGFKRLK